MWTLYVETNILEQDSASILKAEDGIYPKVHVVLQLTRQTSVKLAKW
jgi:hypothetical protein